MAILTRFASICCAAITATTCIQDCSAGSQHGKVLELLAPSAGIPRAARRRHTACKPRATHFRRTLWLHQRCRPCLFSSGCCSGWCGWCGALQDCSAGPQQGKVLELLALMTAFGGLKKTAFGGLKATFGRYSQSNASHAYGLQTPSDVLPTYIVVASTVPSLLI